MNFSYRKHCFRCSASHQEQIDADVQVLAGAHLFDVAIERRVAAEAEQRIQSEIDTAVAREVSAASSIECFICTESIVERVVVLPCGHTAFCRECLDQWFARASRTCPECRSAAVEVRRIFT